MNYFFVDLYFYWGNPLLNRALDLGGRRYNKSWQKHSRNTSFADVLMKSSVLGSEKMYKVIIVEDELFVRLGMKNTIAWERYDMQVIKDTDRTSL